MIWRHWVTWVAFLEGVAVVAVALMALQGETGLGEVVMWQRLASLGETVTWQRMTTPGALSKGHAFLECNCAACHTSVKGPDATKCIACHAGNEALLQRQPTAFHGYINSCRECHIEHQGINSHPSAMDHEMFAKIGLRQLEVGTEQVDEGKRLHSQLSAWIGQSATSRAAGLSPYEEVLNCAACHANQDRHFKLFGQDCAQCHSTTKWTIDQFRHPSPRSTDCGQCHQAPPSHYMGHFHMVSAKVAGKPLAKVNQCYLCHQTTSWNDIKGVGWYKHH
jgi:hypothetical protein